MFVSSSTGQCTGHWDVWLVTFYGNPVLVLRGYSVPRSCCAMLLVSGCFVPLTVGMTHWWHGDTCPHTVQCHTGHRCCLLIPATHNTSIVYWFRLFFPNIVDMFYNQFSSKSTFYLWQQTKSVLISAGYCEKLAGGKWEFSVKLQSHYIEYYVYFIDI